MEVHRLANSQACCVIARLLKSIEKAEKAVDVRVAVHGGVPPMTAPSLHRRTQVLI